MTWVQKTNYRFERGDGCILIPYTDNSGDEKEVELLETPSNVIWHLKESEESSTMKAIIKSGEENIGEWGDVDYFTNLCSYVDAKYPEE